MIRMNQQQITKEVAAAIAGLSWHSNPFIRF